MTLKKKGEINYYITLRGGKGQGGRIFHVTGRHAMPRFPKKKKTKYGQCTGVKLGKRRVFEAEIETNGRVQKTCFKNEGPETPEAIEKIKARLGRKHSRSKKGEIALTDV